MENPEEILHSLEEFTKTKPKDIPRELEEYLCFVAKTGDPIYQWSSIKSLFREKLINVIGEFYESYPTVEIPPCRNVDLFNYDVMKTFILEKLDTFAAAPFTLQRISELLTSPRKEYNRIDKYMRALEKNFLVVSTTEPGGRRATENGDSIMNGLESEHLPESSNNSNDINVDEMDDETPTWPRILQENDTEKVETKDVPISSQDTVIISKEIDGSSIDDSVSNSELKEDDESSSDSITTNDKTHDVEPADSVVSSATIEETTKTDMILPETCWSQSFCDEMKVTYSEDSEQTENLENVNEISSSEKVDSSRDVFLEEKSNDLSATQTKEIDEFQKNESTEMIEELKEESPGSSSDMAMDVEVASTMSVSPL